MTLLRDEDIVSLVDREEGIVKGLRKPRDWDDKDSPVQPSSLDLHIGSIYLPGTIKDEDGEAEKPKDQHVLLTGHTAVVVTLEELSLPNNIAGIGFPPSRVSFQGLLMTNPGHIDPGYQGPMHFAVINMGKKEYVLTKGEAIVTVLLFELTKPVNKDWLERNKGIRPGPLKQETLNRLCSDFVDVKNRAEFISNEAVKKADFKVKLFGGIAAIIVVLISTLGNWIIPAWKTPLNEVQTNIAVLKERLDITNIKDRLDAIEKRQQNLEKLIQDIETVRGAKAKTQK